jgi:hypothetical protein
MTTKFKSSKVPLYPVQGVDPLDYVQALHPSLFTAASVFVPAYSGLTGVDEIIGTIFGTGRNIFVAVQIKGASVSTAPATVTVPIMPTLPPQARNGNRWENAPALLRAVFFGPPPIDLGAANMSSNGVITLPEWDVYNSTIFITGTIMEA